MPLLVLSFKPPLLCCVYDKSIRSEERRRLKKRDYSLRSVLILDVTSGFKHL